MQGEGILHVATLIGSLLSQRVSHMSLNEGAGKEK